MMIYVWGTTASPGIWKVEREVDLVELLSAARVVNYGNDGVNTKQTMYLSIYRASGTRRIEVYKATLEDCIRGVKQPPGLQDGDLLLLETITKKRLNLQTVFSAIGAIASVALLIIRIDRL